MNKEQVKRLELAVQWALDEAVKKVTAEEAAPMTWHQGAWFRGRVTDQVLEGVEVRYGDGLDDVQSLVKLDCGTACCIAGNIAYSAGAAFVAPQWSNKVGHGASGAFVLVDEKRAVTVSLYAANLLGVEEEELSDLFDGANEIDDVVTHAQALADEYGHKLNLKIPAELAHWVGVGESDD